MDCVMRNLATATFLSIMLHLGMAADSVSLSPVRIEAATAILASVIRVIARQSPAEDEERVLGVRHDHVPKARGPVLLRFYEKDLRGDSIETRFERRSEEAGWLKADFGFRPLAFPRDVYRMNLTENFFESLTFVRAVEETRPDERLKLVRVFVFTPKDFGYPVQVRFETRQDVAVTGGKYPTSFHKVVVERIE